MAVHSTVLHHIFIHLFPSFYVLYFISFQSIFLYFDRVNVIIRKGLIPLQTYYHIFQNKLILFALCGKKTLSNLAICYRNRLGYLWCLRTRCCSSENYFRLVCKKWLSWPWNSCFELVCLPRMPFEGGQSPNGHRIWTAQ